ncbi:hypothetical protein EYF80_061662 [Liparis tanakae]|uniref:Uncharacterized protein n=1 Tax=Liparis tanakae TaxID=230148 RepID=A0A4Z2EHY8_9TELE|nr:hypothetical protein EYF80_061662 [Liparis tanakae]
MNTYCRDKREHKLNLNDPPARPESWERRASMCGYLNPTLGSNLILRLFPSLLLPVSCSLSLRRSPRSAAARGKLTAATASLVGRVANLHGVNN